VPKIARHIAKGMQSINWKKLIAEEVDKGVKDALKPIKSEAQPEASGCISVIRNASRKLAPREQNYSVIEREALAIVWAISKFDFYLFGRRFVIQMDHKPMVYVNKAKCLNKRIMRWAIFLQEYQFTIEAVPGKANHGADYLSRVPFEIL
jgi:hypothetical protein